MGGKGMAQDILAQAPVSCSSLAVGCFPSNLHCQMTSMTMKLMIVMSLGTTASACDCSWTSSCGARGCGDCKDDGSMCYHQCCGGGGGPSPSAGPTPPPSPPPPPTPGCEGKTPVDCHGVLKKKGNRIVDQNGYEVKLNGMSMFWSNWAGAFWNGDVVKFLVSDWKIDVVRCAVGISNDDGDVGGGYLQ